MSKYNHPKTIVSIKNKIKNIYMYDLLIYDYYNNL